MEHHCCGIESQSWELSRRAFLKRAGVLGLAATLPPISREIAEAQSDEIKLTWYGQATTKIETEGKVLFIDAFFDQHEAGVPTQAPDLILTLLQIVIKEFMFM
jgi:hypothetical protein